MVEQKVKNIETKSKSIIEVILQTFIPPIYNDRDLVRIGRQIGTRVFKDRYYAPNKPYLAGDNASYYFEKVKGLRIVFFAAKEHQENYPLHNSRFDFDENIIPLAIKTLYYMIIPQKVD